VDPVMIATSGAQLLKPDAIGRAPGRTAAPGNPDHAERARGCSADRIPDSEPEDLRTVARVLSRAYRSAVLLKGGHLETAGTPSTSSTTRRNELLLSAPFVKGVSTHGTGCTYSAAVTAGCAQGLALTEAVWQGKQFITQAIAQSRRIGAHWVLDLRSRQAQTHSRPLAGGGRPRGQQRF